MGLNKNIASKLLCLSAVCCFFACNISYAVADNCELLKQKEKQLEKIKIKKNNYTAQYANLLYEIALLQEQNGDYLSALETYKKLKEANIAIYGINSAQAGHSAFQLKNMYANINPIISREYLKEGVELSKLNPSDNDLDKMGKQGIFYHFNDIEQPYTALKTFNEVVKDENEKSKYINEYLSVYSNLKDYKTAEEYLVKYYDKVNIDNPSELISYFTTYACILMDDGNFIKAKEILEQIDIEIKKLDENDINAKFSHIQNWERFYKDIYNMSETKRYADILADLASKINAPTTNQQLYYIYSDYYKEIKEYKTQKEYIKELKKITKKMYGENTFANVRLNETYIDYYKDIKDYDKAIDYAQKSLDIISSYQNNIPVVHGNILKKIAEIYKDNDNNKLAIEYTNKARELYLKEFSENSYKMYEIEKLLGECNKNLGEYKTAITHFNNTIEIIKNTAGSEHKELIDIKKDLAKAFSADGNYDNAINCIDYAIDLTKKKYGNNNIKVVELLFEKVEILEQNNKKDEVSILTNAIEKMLKNVEGYKVDFYHNYYNYLANNALENDLYDTALIEAKKALEFAKDKNQIKNTNNLLSEIYKKQGKHIKSLKSKLKSK